MSLADAAVDWEGVTPAEYELIVIGEDGLPDMPSRPDLRERAEAILTAVNRRQISGMASDMYGEDLHPRYMRLDRDSVAAWTKETDNWLAEKEAAAEATPSAQLSVPMQQLLVDKPITAAEVREILGLPLSTFKRHRSEGTIPAPISSKPLRWSTLEISNHKTALAVAQKEKEDARKAAKQAKEEEKQRRSEAEAARKKQADAVMAQMAESTFRQQGFEANIARKKR